MPSRLHTPGAPLSAFVKCFWYWKGEQQAHKKERLMPSGEPCVIFTLRDDSIRIYDPENIGRHSSYGNAVFSGARTEGFVIDTDQQERTFGIAFHPGGAFPFFREPACETRNLAVPLDCFWGASVGRMRQHLLDARSAHEMFAVAERDLLERLKRPLALHAAVAAGRREFCRAPHMAAIARVVDQTGLSQRRFIELFHDQIGLTPKTFCRVRRFQRVLQSVHGTKGAEWAQVALDCGYYDQAHFIHDFRAFSGVTPNEYLKRATSHLNHVPIA
ncbi:MAG TPA: helix-turn-helix domain-containing protein [Candidatus Acidoferrum sp.]|nr:helix-turn-helix domain-containing protein [Candidatus Acidoferrum sp.]